MAYFRTSTVIRKKKKYIKFLYGKNLGEANQYKSKTIIFLSHFLSYFVSEALSYFAAPRPAKLAIDHLIELHSRRVLKEWQYFID